MKSMYHADAYNLFSIKNIKDLRMAFTGHSQREYSTKSSSRSDILGLTTGTENMSDTNMYIATAMIFILDTLGSMFSQ